MVAMNVGPYDVLVKGLGQPTLGTASLTMSEVFGVNAMVVAYVADINDSDIDQRDNEHPECRINGGAFITMIRAQSATSINWDVSAAQQAGHVGIYHLSGTQLGSANFEDDTLDVQISLYNATQPIGRILFAQVWRNVQQVASLPGAQTDSTAPSVTDTIDVTTIIDHNFATTHGMHICLYVLNTLRVDSFLPVTMTQILEAQQDDTADGGTFNFALFNELVTGSPQAVNYVTTATATGALGQVSMNMRERSASGGLQPVIQFVDGFSEGVGVTLLPTATAIPVTGLAFNDPTIKTYLADGNIFSTATLVLQTISSVTDTSFTWDAITLDGLSQGVQLYLFHLVREGGTSPIERVSPPYPVIVQTAGTAVDLAQVIVVN